mmetsp:Transcript_11050/g.17818  ORF Transcript_11050/g.17818 Transcript_11050/m.17818 type:complete len:200 (-) Transcript_11050:463-1062(-)
MRSGSTFACENGDVMRRYLSTGTSVTNPSNIAKNSRIRTQFDLTSLNKATSTCNILTQVGASFTDVFVTSFSTARMASASTRLSSFLALTTIALPTIVKKFFCTLLSLHMSAKSTTKRGLLASGFRTASSHNSGSCFSSERSCDAIGAKTVLWLDRAITFSMKEKLDATKLIYVFLSTADCCLESPPPFKRENILLENR